MKPVESPEARRQRLEWERELERIGVASEEGQAMIERAHRESKKGRLTEAELFRGYGVEAR